MKILFVPLAVFYFVVASANASGNLRAETRKLQEDCTPRRIEFLDGNRLRLYDEISCPFPIFSEIPRLQSEDLIDQERPDGSIFSKLPGTPGTQTFYTVGDDCLPTNPYSVEIQANAGNALFRTPVDGPFDKNFDIKQTGEVIVLGSSIGAIEQGVPFEPSNSYFVKGIVESTLGQNTSPRFFQRTYTKVTGKVINLCDQLQG